MRLSVSIRLVAAFGLLGLTAAVQGAWGQSGFPYFTGTPCLLFDSRFGDAPSLASGTPRVITLEGKCGIPAKATDVALNITVANPSAAGFVVLYDPDDPVPSTSNVNFSAGRTISGNAIVHLSANGEIAVKPTLAGGGTLDLLLYTAGYFGDSAPVANADTATVMEDAAATAIDVLANDSDAEGDSFFIASASDPLHGTVVLTGGSPGAHTGLTYQPDADYCNDPPATDLDTFTYTLTPGGATATVSVTVTCKNDAPTDLALSNTTVAEGQPAGTLVGTFSTTDVDAGDTHTYTLVAGTGSDDNAAFQIVGNQLQTNAVFDFETKSSYSIRVRTTDAGGLFFEKQFTITVDNGNDAPTDLALSNASVAENQPAGTTVGSFSTSDPDVGDTFTYTLVAGTGSTDNGSFAIVGNQLQTGAVFDFETKSSYSIRVRTTDAGGLFFEKVFTISVTNMNEAPTDIALDNATLAENQPSGTAVGNFSTTDPDAGDTFTYTLVAGTGSTDNGSFAIVGNQLRTAAVLDFETKSSYSIRVRTTDAGGLFFEKVFTITLTNANEAPTDIALDNATLAENQPSGTAVGNFSTTDQDSGDTFTYTLVAGTGSTDNGSFAIVGNQLRTAAVLDFETKSSYSIRVRSTDSGGLFFEKVFTITLTNVNEAPTDLALSNASVAENQASGTAVGNFSTTDQDSGDTFTYTLVAGTGSTDNGSFTIVGNQLRTNAIFDFETKSSYSIRVRTTDSGGLFFEKVFTISVTNLNEAPTDIGLSNASIDENLPSGTAVGDFSTVDQDSGDTFTYTLVAGTGSTDNASFAIVGNQLRSAVMFNFEAKSSYSIRVRSTDSGGLFVEKVFVISINNVPEPPIAGADAYEAVGNTLLEVAGSSVAAGPKIFFNGNVLANDSDPDGTGTLSATLLAATAGAQVVIVGSSRVDLQACKLEYSIVSPK